MNTKRILCVGQCGADHYSISTFLQAHFNAVEIEPVHSATQAFAMLKSRSYDLVLVNRLLDIDGTAGIDIIRRMKTDADLAALPVMLVSNHAEAQNEALAAGALRGFGKANLGEAALAKIQDALNDEGAPGEKNNRESAKTPGGLLPWHES